MFSRSRALGTVFLLGVTLFSASSRLTAQATPGSVVVSQIYGAGGIGTNSVDFLELFNPGTSIVDLTGWSVQWSSGRGAAWLVLPLNGSLQPGQYLLIASAIRQSATPPIPNPDYVWQGWALDPAEGKLAVVASTVPLSGQCPSRTAATIDLVGYGAYATCAEVAPTYSTEGAALWRADNGCIDSDNNAADFVVRSPLLRRRSSPLYNCRPLRLSADATPGLVETGGESVLTARVVPAVNSTGITVVADLTTVGGSPSQPLSDDGVAPDAAAGDNVFTARVPLLASIAAGFKRLPVTASDQQSNTASDEAVLQVRQPGITLRPHDVQGVGPASLLVTQMVTVEGVVTARAPDGFYIQTVPGQEDDTGDSSEGLFVATGTAPPAEAAIGNVVRATGTVREFTRGVPSEPTVTRLSDPAVALVSTGTTLPARVQLTATTLTPDGGLFQWERFEGMRVSLDPVTVVGPTEAILDDDDAVMVSTGVFYAVFSGGTPRDRGVVAPDPVPPCAAGSGCAIPIFDGNPHRIRVDSTALGALPIDVGQSTRVLGVNGIVSYAERTWTVLADPPALSSAPVLDVVSIPSQSLGGHAFAYSITTLRLRRFFDAVDDPAIAEPVLTPLAFDNSLRKVSLAIRRGLSQADIIGVQEVENLATLQAIAARVNADAVAAGGPDPGYKAVLLEGTDPSGLDVGFLLRGRVQASEVTQWGAGDTFVDPVSGVVSPVNRRPTLSIRATVDVQPNAPRLPGQTYVVVSDLTPSEGSNDPVLGPAIRAQRRAQAEVVARALQTLQTNPNGYPVVAVGGFGASEYTDGYVDVLGTIQGRPASPAVVQFASPDLVEPDFGDASNSLLRGGPTEYRDGNGEQTDHILISTTTWPTYYSAMSSASLGARYPDVAYNDPNRFEGVSDHDTFAVYLVWPNRPPQAVPPVFSSRPPDITIGATSPAGAVVTYQTPTATSTVPGGPVAVGCVPPSGSTFPVGVTTVTCTATDSIGQTATVTSSVTVYAPPTVSEFEIVATHSGLCLEVSGASLGDGAAAVQSTCTGGLNQRWTLQPSGDGYYRFLAQHSGKALDVFQGETADLLPIVQLTPTEGANQQFRFQPTANAAYLITARHSGKVLDVFGAFASPGTPIIQYQAVGGPGQEWQLRAVGTNTPLPPPQ